MHAILCLCCYLAWYDTQLVSRRAMPVTLLLHKTTRHFHRNRLLGMHKFLLNNVGLGDVIRLGWEHRFAATHAVGIDRRVGSRHWKRRRTRTIPRASQSQSNCPWNPKNPNHRWTTRTTRKKSHCYPPRKRRRRTPKATASPMIDVRETSWYLAMTQMRIRRLISRAPCRKRNSVNETKHRGER